MNGFRKAAAHGLMKAARFMARGYNAGEESFNRGRLPYDRQIPMDEDHYVTAATRELICQTLLDLRRNVPLVQGLCERMCDFVVGPHGLQVQAMSSNSAWNSEAEAWFKDWCRSCDITGRWPFRKIQRGLVNARLMAGESFPMFLPKMKLQAVEAERIRHPRGIAESATLYDGMSLSGPVVSSWYVADRDDTGSFANGAGRWVKSENIYHYAAPWRFDSIRSLPDLAAGVNVVTDVSEISLFTLIQMKRQASIAGMTNTADGSDAFGTRGSGSKNSKTIDGIRAQKMDGVGIFLRGMTGETLTLAQPATPNPGLEGHLVFNMRQFCATTGIPYEVAMMDSTRGNLSQNKAVRELFSRVVETWQLDLADFVRFVWAWVIPQAWAAGYIGKAPTDKRGRSEWDRVEIQAPPATWADPQDAADTDAKNMVSGNILHASVLSRRGTGDIKEHYRRRAQEEQWVQEAAAEFGVSPDRIRNMQIAGNASSAPAEPAPTKEPTP
jgi:capsid protein